MAVITLKPKDVVVPFGLDILFGRKNPAPKAAPKIKKAEDPKEKDNDSNNR